MLTPGVFDCTVIEAFWSKSSKKGTPCIATKVEIDDIEGPARLPGAIYITEATVGTKEKPGFAVQQLKTLGYTGPLSDLLPEPTVLIGKGCKCVVEADEKGRLRVAQFGISGVARVAMELSHLEALDRQFNGGKTPPKQAENRTAPPVKKPAADDEYPEGFFDAEGNPKF